jgi:hypothetical protein
MPSLISCKDLDAAIAFLSITLDGASFEKRWDR